MESMRRFFIALTLTLLLIVSIGIGIAVARWPKWRHLELQGSHAPVSTHESPRPPRRSVNRPWENPSI